MFLDQLLVAAKIVEQLTLPERLLDRLLLRRHPPCRRLINRYRISSTGEAFPHLAPGRRRGRVLAAREVSFPDNSRWPSISTATDCSSAYSAIIFCTVTQALHAHMQTLSSAHHRLQASADEPFSSPFTLQQSAEAAALSQGTTIRETYRNVESQAGRKERCNVPASRLRNKIHEWS